MLSNLCSIVAATYAPQTQREKHYHSEATSSFCFRSRRRVVFVGGAKRAIRQITRALSPFWLLVTVVMLMAFVHFGNVVGLHNGRCSLWIGGSALGWNNTWSHWGRHNDTARRVFMREVGLFGIGSAFGLRGHGEDTTSPLADMEEMICGGNELNHLCIDAQCVMAECPLSDTKLEQKKHFH